MSVSQKLNFHQLSKKIFRRPEMTSLIGICSWVSFIKQCNADFHQICQFKCLSNWRAHDWCSSSSATSFTVFINRNASTMSSQDVIFIPKKAQRLYHTFGQIVKSLIKTTLEYRKLLILMSSLCIRKQFLQYLKLPGMLELQDISVKRAAFE